MDEITLFGILPLLTPKRVWNFFKMLCAMALSAVTGKAVVLGHPFSLKVEPTNLCNLRCLQCSTGQNTLTRPRGSMRLEDFRRLLDETADWVFHLLLYFQGEPFLNPELLEFVRYAKAKKVYVILSTNGHFFGEEGFAEKVVASGVDSLIISLDGASAQTYERYRRGGDFDLVVDGIRRVAAAKRAARSPTPLICLQFITMRHNEHEVGLIKQMAGTLGVDRVLIKSMHVYFPDTGRALLPADKRLARYAAGGVLCVRRRRRRICTNLWTSAVVTWDGAVVPCCFDQDARHGQGRLSGDCSLGDVWFSGGYARFRKRVLEDPSGLSMCASCGKDAPYVEVEKPRARAGGA